MKLPPEVRKLVGRLGIKTRWKQIDAQPISDLAKAVVIEDLIEEKRRVKKEYIEQYRQNNHDKILESKRQYRQNNHDKILESKRQYRQNNHDKILESKRQYRQRQRQIKSCPTGRTEINPLISTYQITLDLPTS